MKKAPKKTNRKEEPAMLYVVDFRLIEEDVKQMFSDVAAFRLMRKDSAA